MNIPSDECPKPTYNPLIETEEWKLGAFLEWRPKHRVIDCPHCLGTGWVGGGFKDLDGPRECPQCYGTKIKRIPPSTPAPELPKELVEHMRRAWWDYVNKN